MNENVEHGVTIDDQDGRVIVSEQEPTSCVTTREGGYVGRAQVVVKPSGHQNEEIAALRAEITYLRARVAELESPDT